MLRKHKNTVIVFAFFLLIIFIIACVSPSFRTWENFCNLLVQFVPLAIVSLGQTLVIIAGGIDLTVGTLMAFTTTILATTTNDMAGGVPIGLLLVVLFGAAVGAFNAFGAAYMKLPPMIVTLCSQTILQGVTYSVLNRQGGKVLPALADALAWRSGPFSVPLFVLILTCLILIAVLTKTRFGLHLYACGNNQAIADSVGIKSRKVIACAYLGSALLAVLAGIIMAGRLRSGDPNVGAAYGLDSITAALIGGASLSGGQGLALGSILGALIIGTLSNIMNSLGVTSFFQYILKGAILILTMAIYSVTGKVEGRKNAF